MQIKTERQRCRRRIQVNGRAFMPNCAHALNDQSPSADLNEDNQINNDDLFILLSKFDAH